MMIVIMEWGPVMQIHCCAFTCCEKKLCMNELIYNELSTNETLLSTLV